MIRMPSRSRRRIRRPFFAALLLFALLGFGVSLAPRGAQAQTGHFFDEFAPNGRTAALGQAFTGIADGPGAAYYNPAGLGYATDNSTLGYRYVHSDLGGDMNGPGPEPVKWHRPPTRGITVSLVDDMNVEVLSKNLWWFEPLAWGVDLFMPLPEITEFRGYADTGHPFFFRYDSRPSILALSVSFAYRLFPWLSLGGGILPNVTSFQNNRNRVRLNAPPDDPVKGLDLTIHQKSTGDTAPILGVMIKPPFWGLGEWVTLGATYRGKIGNYFGTGTTDTVIGMRSPDGTFVPIVKLPTGLIVNFVGFSPRQGSIGLGLRPRQDLLIGLDLTYKKWSDFHFYLDREPKPRFEDTWTPRLGVEYVIPIGWDTEHFGIVKEIGLRTGYYFEPTPQPDVNGPMNILDSDQHVASLGCSLTTQGFQTILVRWETFLQVHMLPEREVRNAESDPWRPLTSFGGTVYNFGFELTLNF